MATKTVQLTEKELQEEVLGAINRIEGRIIVKEYKVSYFPDTDAAREELLKTGVAISIDKLEPMLKEILKKRKSDSEYYSPESMRRQENEAIAARRARGCPFGYECKTCGCKDVYYCGWQKRL